MTRIDFYTHVENKYQLACTLSAKALARHHRVLIYTADNAATEAMDAMLWRAPAISFLPHCRGKHQLIAETPIIIDHAPGEFPHNDILLNLHPECPFFFSRFQRLIEIVSTAEGDRVEARRRFRFYRDRGYEIHSHVIGKTQQ